jgi:hypothetical protein
MNDKSKKMLNSLNLTNSDLEFILLKEELGPFRLIEVIGSGSIKDSEWLYTEFTFYNHHGWPMSHRGYIFTGRVFCKFSIDHGLSYQSELLGERNYTF